MTEPTIFSPATRAALAQAGWTEDYVCPELDEYRRALVDDGYEVSDAAREFLRRFGGLRRVEIPLVGVPGVMESFHTRADDAVSKVFSETASGWGEMVGAPVCVVGGVYGDHMALAMDSGGRVFAAEGILVAHIGDSGAEAIEKLCTGAGYPWPRIGYPCDEPEEARAEQRPRSPFWDGLRRFLGLR